MGTYGICNSEVIMSYWGKTGHFYFAKNRTFLVCLYTGTYGTLTWVAML